MSDINDFDWDFDFDELEDEAESPRTKNGASSLLNSGNSIVDLFAKGGAYRKRSDGEVVSLFSKAFNEDRLLALKTLFYLRDCRGGQGERRFFRVCLSWLAKNHPAIVVKNLPALVVYGRWDDYFVLFETKVENYFLAFIKEQFEADVNSKEKNISLLGKWLPSINTSSRQTRFLAEKFRKAFGLSPRNYRKKLSALREKINVLERLMCSGDWAGVDYSAIPSKAGLLYSKAFHRHDNPRYLQWQKDVMSGKTKINAAVLNPYDIVSRLMTGGMNKVGDKYFCDVRNLDEATKNDLNMFWEKLPDYFDGNSQNILCVCDTSGSMRGAPVTAAISLSIYTAERNKGMFSNFFLTFSQEPDFQEVEGDNIYSKVQNMARSNWGENTNLQAVFDLILNRAIERKVPAEEMPAEVIIISDMQFDKATPDNKATNFQVIEDKFKGSGYKLPSLTFWNVNATGNDSPVTFDKRGVKLVSGYSPSIFRVLLGGNVETPLDLVKNAVEVERYAAITL